jgi:hypothetical protein
MAADRRRELDIHRDIAAGLGRSAVEAARSGIYVTPNGQTVVWRDAVHRARAAKVSIEPDAILQRGTAPAFAQTRVQVSNETTLGHLTRPA